jgi:tetratricopeptide (TPR) repeat protein
MMGRTVAFALAVLALASCASQRNVDQQTFDTAPLFGMIYDGDNQPCAGVQLTVDGRPGPVTDIRGRFVVPDLSRGEHTILAHKAGYEDLSTNVTFLSRTDALHLGMTSFDQLLDLARQSIADTRWKEAETYLSRAARIDPADGVLRYLDAVLAWKKGDFQSAESSLTSILDSGAAEPAVFLFLADIYQNDLKDHAKAIASLESYLKLRADPDAESRLAGLKAGQMKEVP